MSRYRRDPRRSIVFYDREGRMTGKVVVVESGSRGNRHFNPRRPNGPTCGMVLGQVVGAPPTLCTEPWQPICPNHACPGNRIPRSIIRHERFGPRWYERHKTRREANG